MVSDLTIRTARLEDAGAILAIYAPLVERTVVSFEERPPSEAEMAERIGQVLAAHPFLVAERHGEVLGYAYAGPHRVRPAYRWSVDVTAYVAEAARGHGIGKRLYLQLLAELAERQFHAAFAGIALPNPASIALHEAMGFRQLGIYREVGYKFGSWHDVGWWQRLV